MKIITSTFLALSLCVYPLIAQSDEDRSRAQRIDSTDRGQILPQTSNSSGSSSSVAKSDTGAQRPVKLSKNSLSPFLGYDVKMVYRSNPLAASGKLKQLATGVWTHTFYAGLGLGVFDFGDSVVTPYVGGSWSSNEYSENNLIGFNYYSTSAYAMLLAQYTNGWSARAGLSYASDRSAKYKTEDYSELYPSVGIMKVYSINSSTSAIFEATLGKHDATSYVLPFNGATEDQLSNWDATLSYGLRHRYGKFTISPKLSTTYKVYDDGVNKDRDDWVNRASLSIDYPVVKDVRATLLASYTNRDSSGTDQNYDYKSWDGGIGINVSTRF